MLKATLLGAAVLCCAIAGCATVEAGDRQILSTEALAPMMIGSTHYVDVGRSSDAVIYYASADVAHMALPDGAVFTGAWRFTASGYYVDWVDGPEGEWRIAFEPGRLTYLDASGAERGDITQIAPGDAHGFGG